MRQRIDLLLTAWGHFAVRHAWKIIVAALLVVGTLSSQLPLLTLETSTEEFLKADNPTRIAYDEFRNQFGRDDQIVLAIRTESVFDRDFLARLRAIHEDIENEVPNLEDVSSLVNARNTRGEGDQLIVGELLEEMPETDAELAKIEQLVRANPMYPNLLISEDSRFATILIRTNAYSSLGDEFDELGGFDDEFSAAETADPAPRAFITPAENAAIVDAIESVIERHDGNGIEIFLSGTPPMIEAMEDAITRDMALFTGLAIGIIILALAVLFRRLAGVVLPVVTVIFSLITTLAIMVLLDVAITVPTQILPSFLLAVGVGYSVHILAIFYQRRRAGDDVESAIAFSLGHSGLAIMMTSLTTAGGLLSFSVAELAPIAEFGIFAPLGVLIALIFTLLLLPALLAVFPMRAEDRSDSRGGTLSQRLLMRTGEFANTHAPSITLVTAGLIAFSVMGALQIEFAHDPISWFPEDNRFRIANDVINDELRGAMFLEVLVDSGRDDGIQDPELLDRLDKIRQYGEALLVQDVKVGKTISIVDVVKETNRALNENLDEFYRIPEDRLLVAQELLLFENSGSDDLEDLVDSRFSMARMTLKVSMADAIQYQAFIEHIDGKFSEILDGTAELRFTGIMKIVGDTINAVIMSMAKTYVVAFAIITPLMVLLIGRVRIGLVAMIPNLTPIIITLGLMGWTGIPLDAFTLLVGSIAIGLAVDDTIHFMHHFRHYYEATGSVSQGISETLRSTGQALLYTSLVLSSGFFIYMLASMQNLFYFGLLTGLTILLAFLCDVILAPALITLSMRGEESRVVAPQTMETSP
jgi:predicted RND superfamily exporter protein